MSKYNPQNFPLLEDVTILIKTFARYPSLRYLLQSIAATYPSCRVLISDDSEQPYREAILEEYAWLVDEYIVLPFDVGLSHGRNVLLQKVETEYFVLCDDDFIFDERADLHFLKKHLEQSDLDLLAGLVYYRFPRVIADANAQILRKLFRFRVQTVLALSLWYSYRSRRRWLNHLWCLYPFKEVVGDLYGRFQIIDGVCYLVKDLDYTPPYTRCDFTLNFFMAKTNMLRRKQMHWNNSIRYHSEDFDFFLRGKRNGLNVAMTREVGIVHQQVQNRYYQRGRNDTQRMLKANGLQAMRIVRNLEGLL